MVRFEWRLGGSHVLLAGSFTNWKAYPMLLQYNSPDDYYYWLEINLPKGHYEYKFVVDGQWVLDDSLPIIGKPPHIHHVLDVTTDSKTHHDNQKKPTKRFNSDEVIVCENNEDVLNVLQQGAKVKLGTELRHVFLSYSGLSEEQLFRFLEALKDNTTLQILNLSHNNLSENFTKTLFDLLNSTSIKELHLWSCGITDNGVTLLSRILPKNTHLTTITLRGNKIGAAGSQALASAVLNHPLVRLVDLWDNPLGEEGFLAWAKVVKEGILKELHLDNGTNNTSSGGSEFQIKKKTAKEWLEAIHANKSLTDLHIILNDRPPFKLTVEFFENK